MIVGQDGDACAGGECGLVDSLFSDPSFVNPAADGFGHVVEFGVGVALDLVLALEFDGDIVRPALGAFDETIVERGHGLN